MNVIDLTSDSEHQVSLFDRLQKKLGRDIKVKNVEEDESLMSTRLRKSDENKENTAAKRTRKYYRSTQENDNSEREEEHRASSSQMMDKEEEEEVEEDQPSLSKMASRPMATEKQKTSYLRGLVEGVRKRSFDLEKIAIKEQIPTGRTINKAKAWAGMWPAIRELMQNVCI